MKRILLAALAALALIAPAAAQVVPGARLTITQGHPDMRGSADTTSGTIWLAPYHGDQEPVYYLGAWVALRVTSSATDTAGASLAYSGWTNGSQYDVFVTTTDGTTPLLCSGHSAWPSSTATEAQRGLAMLNGVMVNGAAIQCDGTSATVTCPQYGCTHVGSISTEGGGGGSGTPVLSSLGSASSGAAGVSTGTMTTSAAIVAGNTAGFAVTLNFNNGVSIVSVSDGTNSYARAAASGLIGSVSRAEIWTKDNAAAVASGATVTVTLSAAGTGGGDGFGIVGFQVSNLLTTGSLDQAAGTGAANVSTQTATTAALAQANEIAIGAGWDGNSSLTYTVPSGFTNAANIPVAGGNGREVVDYKVTSTTAAVAYQSSWSASNDRLAIAVATFKANGSSPSGAQIVYAAAPSPGLAPGTQARRVGFWNRYNQLPLTLQVVAPWNDGPSCAVFKPGGDPNVTCWVPTNQYPAWVPFANDAANKATVFTGAPQDVAVDYHQSGFANTTAGPASFVFTVGWDGASCGYWRGGGVDSPIGATPFEGGNGGAAHCPVAASVGAHTATQFVAGANTLSGIIFWSGYNPAALPAGYSIDYDNLMTVRYGF